MIYFDYASTTPVRKQIIDTYIKVLSSYYGNSDSMHEVGRTANKLMEQSREQIAQLLKVDKDEVIFTSCASEANNLAIKGYAWKYQHRGKHIITSRVEHSSVLKSVEQLKDVFGFDVTYLPVNEDGVISLDDLKQALRPDTILVSLMMVNNETGACNPIEECANYIKANSRAVIHVDAVQGMGKLPLTCALYDMVSFSAHKIYGLKGSAVLYKKKNIELVSLISGGQQEMGLRGGTSNAPQNIVLAKTLRLMLEEQELSFAYVSSLNQILRNAFASMDGWYVNSPKQASPYILNVSCAYIGSEILLNALNTRGFAVSAKSTCSSKSKVQSHVLKEMGLEEFRTTNAIRISLSSMTTKQEVYALIEALKEIYHEYRTI